MKEESVSRFLSKIVEEFSNPNTYEEKTIIQKIKWIREHKSEILDYFDHLTKRTYKSLSSSPTREVEKNWFRAVTYDYSKIPLSFEGSLKSHARFNRAGQPTIYLAENYDTALKEVRFPKNLIAQTIFSVNIKLQRILNLSETENLYKNFLISKPYFRGPWNQFLNIGLEYYTHYLSDHLRSLPIEGFLFESNANPENKCLCLFPEKLIRGSVLKVEGEYEHIEPANLLFEGQV